MKTEHTLRQSEGVRRMQKAECRTQNEEQDPRAILGLFSKFLTLHSAFCIRLLRTQNENVLHTLRHLHPARLRLHRPARAGAHASQTAVRAERRALGAAWRLSFLLV